jgi:hypothetical protein
VVVDEAHVSPACSASSAPKIAACRKRFATPRASNG